ncbi:membrane hypothetical protein [Nostocoides japonicum T1-X7]|uniref:Uncharacterized protein n=1 Tax=Nostocoides japonicum T1-X7 TaxID=1194083 RepID=A0A077M3W5_9MICO|nr:membrane hypothetical protein [Tetrasphaera japonica T1-X7]
MLTGLAFFGVAVWVIETSDLRTAAAFPVWACLVLGTAVANCVVLHVGVAAGRRVGVVFTPWRVLGCAGLVVAVVGCSLAVGPVIGSSRDPRGTALVAASLAAAVPALTVLQAVGEGGWNDAKDVPGRLTAFLLVMRSTRRVLFASGSLVALTTLSLGAAVTVRQQALTGGRSVSELEVSGVVVIFGAIGSALVAAVYTPAYLTLRRVSEMLTQAMFPLPAKVEDPVDATQLLQALEQRARLATVLGIGPGMWLDLQSSIAILGPLISTACAVLLAP